MSSARRGSKCELTSPDGHISSLDDEHEYVPHAKIQGRRRCKDLSAWNTVAGPPKSPTDVQGPLPGSPRFKFPPAHSTPNSPSRRSTSDLTEMHTTTTSLSRPSSPRGSVKGLAFLASRRCSGRDSGSRGGSSIEDLGPLNFQASARLRQRRTSNFLELPAEHGRPRVSSLPERGYNPRSGDELYRLRTFSITNKGVVNYGDSIIDRRSRSNTSVNSTASNRVSPLSPWQGSCCSYNSAVSSETLDIARYRVVLLGDSGVGKTALVSQFMTSEYMNTYDVSLGLSDVMLQTEFYLSHEINRILVR